MNPPFLNRSRCPVRLRVPSGKDQEGVACAKRFGSTGNRCQRLVTVAPVDRDESAEIEHLAHDRKLVELRLVQHVEPRVQRFEQDRRVDVALVIRAEDHRGRRHVLPSCNTIADAGQRERQPDASVSKRVQSAASI